MLFRPPSPPLRSPSPLGLHDDGVSDGPVNRSASAPPNAPPQIRVPSPGNASAPLRPPVRTARKTSLLELQKIESGELNGLIQRTVGENHRLGRALIVFLNKVSKSWTIPQRAVRGATRDLVHQLCQNSHELMGHLRSVSQASRKILNFIATCIKETHGLRHFRAIQPLKPVLDELSLLHTKFTSIHTLSLLFSTKLNTHSNTLEKGMEPDTWSIGGGESDEMRVLKEAAKGVEDCYVRLKDWLGELMVGEWKPPLLSPEDVKAAAKKWKDVELGALKSTSEIRSNVKYIVDVAQKNGFISKEESELAQTILYSGNLRASTTSTTGATGEASGSGQGTSDPSIAANSIHRAHTTLGHR